jgi:hypothetical protein
MQQLVQRVQQLLLRVPEKLAFFLVIAVPTIALMTYFVLSDTERLDTPTASDPTAQRAVLSPTSAPPAAAVRATPMPTRGEATASPRLASGSLAPAASATAGGALASDLYTRLRSSSLSTGELPPGFTLPVLRTSTTLADTLAPGQPLVGAVEISVHGPDARDLADLATTSLPHICS